MGAEIDGIEGWVGGPIEPLLQSMILMLWLMSEFSRPLRWLQVGAGRLIRFIEYRRLLLGTLFYFWKGFQPDAISYLWSLERETEVLILLSLLPLAVTNLRAPHEGAVLCSDASLKGGGVCESSSLSETGAKQLLDYVQQGKDHEDGRDAGPLHRTQRRLWGAFEPIFVLCVGLFDGLLVL